MLARRGDEPKTAKDWEDECYRLRAAHTDLQLLSNVSIVSYISYVFTIFTIYICNILRIICSV